MSDALHLYRVASAVPLGDPIGVTIAEWVRFRRALIRGAYVGRPIIAGRRVVLIPKRALDAA